MKAILLREFGGAELFEVAEIGQPVLQPKEVLVKVHATSINPVDYKIRSGGGVDLPAVLGYDVSGVIEDVGRSVKHFKVGDEVFYSPETSGEGSYAEYHAANEEIVALKPVNLTHIEAASLPLAGLTAWDALVAKAKLRVGESVLIHGGGGVGSLALQIARAAGAYVMISCSDYMQDLARELGADRVINYKTEDFVPIVKAETDGFGVDVVIDTVGGDLLTRSIEITKPFGRLVGIVRTSTGFKSAFPKNITVYPTYMERARYKLNALRVLAERGDLKPVIAKVMPLEEVAEAHRQLEAGDVKGKIVLQVAKE